MVVTQRGWCTMGESTDMNKAALPAARPPLAGLGLERKVPASHLSDPNLTEALIPADRDLDTCSGRQSSLLNRMRAFGQLFLKLFAYRLLKY